MISGWRFLAIDITGAFLSLMALAVQHTFDVLGGTGYIVALTMEIGIGGLQITWLWRTSSVRREARKAGLVYDDFVNLQHTKHDPTQGLSETVTDIEKQPQGKENWEGQNNQGCSYPKMVSECTVGWAKRLLKGTLEMLKRLFTKRNG
jgi:hypothetical protein